MRYINLNLLTYLLTSPTVYDGPLLWGCDVAIKLSLSVSLHPVDLCLLWNFGNITATS